MQITPDLPEEKVFDATVVIPSYREGAFRDQNMNMMRSLLEDYSANCLVGTTTPLTLKPGFESVETERHDRETLLRFCFKFYVGEHLRQLLSEYLNLLIEAKIRAKEALPINFKAMAKALTQTIATSFPKFG